MKKFILSALMCTLAVATYAATFVHPGWKCTDVSKLDTMYAIAKEAKDFNNASIMACLKKFAEVGVPTTFDAYKKLIEDAVDVTAKDMGITDAKQITDEKTRCVVQSAYCRSEFTIEAYQFCLKEIKNGDIWCKRYTIHFVLYRDIEITANDKYTIIKNWCMEFDEINLNKQAIDAMVAVSNFTDIDDATLKADFKKLNRKYSAKLIENKEKYEPIVAKIRTILETL